MLCPSCSHVVPDHARYCSACGRPIVSAQSPTFTSPGYAGQRAVVTHQPRTAGTILAERYRIVGLLGRGGMGEVYRADDLKLGQAVALKFLPPETRGDPAALERFRNEVRVARQVSHPNVCRIYDLSDGDGEPFLSMEYVDGEDLASLLRRIGRLPPDKAVQVARQLCAGLSAAHDLGVLHRDLKPANVMLDGRGVAKITDFGLADFAERIAPHEIAGTPGYMAPEQLTGAPASTRTDLYSLGLVLFEMFTGAPAFVPGSPEDRRRASRDSSPPTPAATQPAIDPAVDRVIVRCLDPDPAKRPPSARAVAAALPGGDPLAAALAAGETPSPEMVAQAGGVGSLQPWVAWSLFATIVACLIAIGLMSDRARLTRMLGVNQSPEVLRARAKAILARVGHTETPLDTIHGFEFDVDYAAYLVRENSAAAWNNARKGRPALIRFWYRQGPSWMTPWTVAQRPTLGDPPAVDPGSAAVLLDPQGRLIRLAVLPTAGETQGPPTGVDWAPVFDEAGLRLSDFTPAPPARIPPL
jgi:serine/threonine-protein kinase